MEAVAELEARLVELEREVERFQAQCARFNAMQAHWLDVCESWVSDWFVAQAFVLLVVFVVVALRCGKQTNKKALICVQID